MAEESKYFLLHWLNRHLGYLGRVTLRREGLPSELQRMCDTGTYVTVERLNKKHTEELQGLIDVGLDPRRISQDAFRKYFSDIIGQSQPKPRSIGGIKIYSFWKRDTVDKMAALGFPVHDGFLPVVEDQVAVDYLGVNPDE